jgi:peptidoglycan/LPS O-acetylase OafA/YrhL
MQKRFASLDGLRAISAAMVVLGHAGKMLHVGRNLPFGAGVIDVWGPVGVTVFFVVSGFLITRLLVEERNTSQTISLRGFYLRRAFRILPAFWTYVAVIGLLWTCGLVLCDSSSFLRALTFSTDYLNPNAWVLNHSWSLSVEEQFYLFWPFMLVAIGFARARKVAIALIVLAPIARVLTFFFAPQLRPNITSMLHLRVDALMIGCWAALSYESGSRLLAFLQRPAVALASVFYCLVLTAAVRRMGWIESGFGYGIEAFGALSIILWAIHNSHTFVGRALNSKAFVWLGVRSYSLYLWQQLWNSHEVKTPAWQVPLCILGAVLCAELSYRFVEKPMLRLRSRLNFERPAALAPVGARTPARGF